VRHLSFTKKALPYTKEFDRAEWATLCEYIALHHEAARNPDPNVPDALGFCLRTLMLNVIAGKPDNGWDDIAPIAAVDFSSMTRMRRDWGMFGGVDLEWAEQLMEIKGVKNMVVKALVEHCARPVSEKQAFWVAFSKSVEHGGFGEWIKSVMVEGI
jgi:hypothetical protein